MDRTLLTHLPAVLAVARARSFVRAAADLGVGASAVSHSIRAVEQRIGIPLFARTTRSVALTEEGVAFVAAAERAAEALDDVVDHLRAGQDRISGVVRINAPHIAMHLGLVPVLAEMTSRYPLLTVEVITDDALRDVVAAGFDAGIRLGEMIAQDMVAVRMSPPFRAIVVAAPKYLAEHGTPRTVDELSSHNCIGFRLLGSGAVYAWDLLRDGKDISVDVTGTIRLSDPSFARELAADGLGITYVLEPLARRYVSEGRLVEILPDASIWEPGLFLYFLQGAARSPKLRALVDVTRMLCASQFT